MAVGYILPCSVYVGAASGNLTQNYYVPATNTNTFGDVQGVQVIASLGADAPLSLKFIVPNPLPTGTPKLRSLFQANATSGVAKYTVKDGNAGNSTNPGVATLTTETQASLTWATADILVENKVTLTGLGTPAVGDLLVVGVTFNATGWTLAAILSGLHMLVWE